MTLTAHEAWTRLLDRARQELPEQTFKTWLEPTEALSLNEELQDPRGIAWSLETFAGLLAARGDAEASARLWAAADRLLETVGLSIAPFIKWIRDRHMEHVKMSLGAGRFDAAFAEGRAISAADAIALARRAALSLQ